MNNNDTLTPIRRRVESSFAKIESLVNEELKYDRPENAETVRRENYEDRRILSFARYKSEFLSN